MTTATPVDTRYVGRVFGDRYKILSKVARGGMAGVYKALDTRLSRVVAVKIMHEGLGDDLDFARRFDREARAAARLSHPNIVAVFDQGEDDGMPYIVMEYVEGRTLRQVISQRAPLSPNEALDLIEPVVRALAAAHEVGLVHCDVKPENVLISDRGVVKVADFGLAKAVTGQTVTATQGLLIGTVSYIPPELVTSGKATSRSDVYSTGVVLFELLTGRKPHAGDSPIQVAYSHVHTDIPAPSTVLSAKAAASIPAYVDALVQACTRRTPGERPLDARAMQRRVALARRALSSHVTDDPALATRLGAGPVADETDPATPVSPVTPVTARSATISTAATPTEPSTQRWHYRPSAIPVDEPGPRARVSTPISPVDFENSFDGEPYDPSLVTKPPSRPLVRISQSKVHRRRRSLVALILLLVLSLGAGGGAWYWYAEARWTNTPALTNMTEQEAHAALTTALLGDSVSREFSEDVSSGRVIRTDPTAGSRILRDGSVTLVVSQGPERFDAPTLIGLTKAAATSALAAVNLVPGTITEAYSETAAAGTVVSSSVDPGTKLKRGAAVDFVLSKGPQPIPITSHAGQPTDQARQDLEAAGFTVNVTEDNSKTVPKGSVISQTPDAGQGKKGDTITLVSSKGPVMIQVPSVRGKGKDEAAKILANAGFQTATKAIVAGGIAFGIAYGTDPAAGTSAPEGSTVTILIG